MRGVALQRAWSSPDRRYSGGRMIPEDVIYAQSAATRCRLGEISEGSADREMKDAIEPAVIDLVGIVLNAV